MIFIEKSKDPFFVQGNFITRVSYFKDNTNGFLIVIFARNYLFRPFLLKLDAQSASIALSPKQSAVSGSFIQPKILCYIHYSEKT